MPNNVTWWYPINKFAPTILTLVKGSQILSAISKDDQDIRIYVHTVDISGEANIPTGVELAKSLDNWETFEFRVFRAPMPTPDLRGWTFLGTVMTRNNRCVNHVWYRKREDILS